MTKLLVLFLFTLGISFVNQKIELMNLYELHTRVNADNDTLYVVNFWATWCKPCVAELSYFEKANSRFQNKPVKVVLISLDGVKSRKRVENFVYENGIQSEVFLFTETNPNKWVNAVDSSWSGAIPATVMYRHGKKKLFYEGDLNQSQLDSIILNHIQ